jgi:hypothetical protein
MEEQFIVFHLKRKNWMARIIHDDLGATVGKEAIDDDLVATLGEETIIYNAAAKYVHEA